MKSLRNQIPHEELKRRLYEETEPRITISFYKYFNIADPVSFRDDLYKKFYDLKVFGRIYIAKEGINAQMSVPESNFEAFKNTLYQADPELDQLRLNIAIEDDGKSFWVLKMKVREKIVADGIEDENFDLKNTGKYLGADEYNKLAEDPDTIVVDMRNHYEYEVGHFEGAIEIPSSTFREQLPMAVEMLSEHKDKNIIMYCTGGIRCEKASAYLKHNGFKKVYHLEGGIINYVHKAKEKGLPIKFKGKNFVFDNRMGERITDDILTECHLCGNPCDNHTNCKNDSCHLLFIQCDDCREKLNGCCSKECMEEINLPIEEIKKRRSGKNNGLKIFNKSKEQLLLKRNMVRN